MKAGNHQRPQLVTTVNKGHLCGMRICTNTLRPWEPRQEPPAGRWKGLEVSAT